MHILLDARMMGAWKTRGIGRYVEELIRSLRTCSDLTLTLLVQDPDAVPFAVDSRLHCVRCTASWYSAREQWEVWKIIRQIPHDLFHVPHWNVPLLYRGPLVTTIHDLILLHQRASTHASLRHPIIASAKYAGYRLALRRAVRHSRVLFTPTQFVKDELIARFQTDPVRVVVTGMGISLPNTFDISNVLAYPYVLYVGSAYPHKRLDLVRAGWERLHSQHPNLHLVIVSDDMAFLSRYSFDQLPRTHVFPSMDDARLAALYAHATAFLFPSADEGFGLPPLEALSQGCPVIASDSSCLPEVLPRDGVFFFRDGSLDDMMMQVEIVLKDPASARERISRVRDDVRARYRWMDVAAQTRRGYIQALGM